MKVYYGFNNPFPVDFSNPYLNLPPMTIDNNHLLEKYPAILLIFFQVPFMLSIVTLMELLPPLLTLHKFLS